MGCWNGTCIVSNLSIRHGDRAVGIVLVPRANSHLPSLGGGYCYPTDNWQPCPAPFVGEYNDYGSIENIKSNTATQLLVKCLNFKNEEELISYAERDDQTNSMGEYGLCMIHGDVYDFLIGKFKNAINSDVKEIQEIANNKIPSSLKEDEQFEPMISFVQEDNINKLIGSHYGDGVYKPTNFTGKILDADSVDSSIVKIKYINNHFNRLRKLWSPQAGAGSQSTNFQLQAELAQVVIDIYKGVIKEYTDENGDDYKYEDW